MLKEISWDEMNNLFIASFHDSGYYKDATFDKLGSWVETSTYLAEEDLPDAILEYIALNFEWVDYPTP